MNCGKEQKSNCKNQRLHLPRIKDKSIGIILYHVFPRSLKFLIVKHKKGHWSFAKGHRDKGETSIQTAVRELYEETGIKNIKFISKKILLEEKYVFISKKKIKVLKSVEYFIAESKNIKVKIDKKEITNFKWSTVKTGVKLITFSQSRNLLKKADRLINKKINNKKF